MRKLIALTFLTLDGIMQAPGGPQEDPSNNFVHGGWMVPYFDEHLGKVMDEQMHASAELLLGRKTFQIFASYWPDHEDDWPMINTMRKYVVSTTLSSHSWNNSIFIQENVSDTIATLKNEEGPDLHVHGSSNLLQTLLKNDLVDELWLKIFPVTLGSGKRLFGEGTIPSVFTLASSQTTPKGVIVASYKKAGQVETGSF